MCRKSISIKQMNIKHHNAIYFIGIGGIGMSALAQYFLKIGKKVSGYDRTPTEITDLLQEQGISIHFHDDVNLIPQEFKNPSETLVVFTPAIKQLSELDFFTQNGFQIVKRSEVLGMITRETFSLAVAGTHGKTTTSSILAHILVQANAKVSAFLGGISENFNSNLVLNGNEMTIAEADEFDRSFLRLSPDIACVTAMDSDHLDIYGTDEEFQKGFVDFSKKIKSGGKLIVRNGLPLEGITYGIEDNSDYEITNIRVENGGYCFDIHYFEVNTKQRKTIENVRLFKPGRHHLLNALAAVAMGHQAGFSIEILAQALASFKGVKRRFSYVINTENQVLIDDYAHHPTELEALYQAVREMYPDKELTIIFQPHLYTRTRDFAEGFARSLSQFDHIVLLDIYPARELPIEGITSQWLLSQISSENKILLPKEELLRWVSLNRSQVLVVAGAGDIGAEVEKIKTALVP